ncbi:hypothetical protein VHEMI09885 [[Torrubiella] hemipterigena]|uniref:Enoyl reductase (ER) domain-containing protein n=1 Tax=[Torrubiella] hemipterigena TaxID=1531966 RepID=A0A0A1TSB0_9HYPO|nr:hypothetical protein VHEMI09885 [[Torrubiella] hemipterigena]
MMQDTMNLWALVEWDKPLEKIQQPKPVATGTQVVVKVTHVGVCHSDLHFAEGFYDLGKGNKFHVKDRGVKLPVALGHEILGEVAMLGPDTDAASAPAVGSAQIVYPWLGCGSCVRCKHSSDNLCAAQKGLGTLQNGGFAEYVVVPHPRYLVALGNLDPAVACAYGCSGITSLSAVSKVLPLPPDEPILLVGAGGLGLTAVSMLKALGHDNIVVADISDEKLASATALGAAKVVNTALNGGSGAAAAVQAAMGVPIIAAVDFVNNSATASMINTIVAKGAKWVQVGAMGGSLELSLVANVFKGLTIYSNITGTLEELEQVVKLANDGKLNPIPVVKMPWDQVNEAMDLLKSGRAQGRIILVK